MIMRWLEIIFWLLAGTSILGSIATISDTTNNWFQWMILFLLEVICALLSHIANKIGKEK